MKKTLQVDLKNATSGFCDLTIGWEKSFTSNALRHGFASHLNEADVDIKFIQEALGHETQSQTRTYLADLEDSVITDAINKTLP